MSLDVSNDKNQVLMNYDGSVSIHHQNLQKLAIEMLKFLEV